MPKIKMTTVTLARLKPPKAGQIDYFDNAFPALALRMSHKGTCSWTYFGRVDGKLKRATLGRYPATSLAEARHKASSMAEAMRAGVDPARAKRAEQAVDRNSIETVIAEWLQRDQVKNRSVENVRAIFDRYVLPAWQGRTIGSIARRDAIDLIDSVVDRGFQTMANRLHAHLHRFFRWCVGRGIIERNPTADLPRQGKLVSRDRTLNDTELALVWKAASEIGSPFGPLYHLLILTGARREEIGGLRWSEIDGDMILLPPERTKPGHSHTIPLSPSALALVKQLPRISDSELAFTTTGTTAVSGWSKAKLLLDTRAAAINDGRALPEWRTHDLRRTVATGMQRLGIGLQVVEAVLGHVSGSRAGIVGVYQRHDYAAEKRAALEAWGRHVAGLVTGLPHNVISLRRQT
jgi:integrase